MHNVAADPFRLVSGKAIGDIGAVLEDWQGELVAHQGDGVRCDDFVLRTCSVEDSAWFKSLTMMRRAFL